MIVTGGVLWWRCYIICGCYSVPVDEHQVRIYNGDSRLSNDNMISYQLTGQALLLDCLGNRLAVFCSDGIVNLFNIELSPNHNMGNFKHILNYSEIICALFYNSIPL